MEPLAIIWFVVITLLWTGYLLLEGFDLGVGMHMIFSTRSERDRRVMLNTIGPVWDGNETWLVLGGGGLFAVFPLAYATLLPALYIPLTLMLLALVFRGVAFEFRFKARRSKRFWGVAFALGSLFAAFAQGVILGEMRVQAFGSDGGGRTALIIILLLALAALARDRHDQFGRQVVAHPVRGLGHHVAEIGGDPRLFPQLAQGGLARVLALVDAA